jgi:predicted regulator of Ras-like GTPase activity (Roadblock/LC7/MglB family)
MFRRTIEGILDSCEGSIFGIVMDFDGMAVETVTRDKEMDPANIATELSFVLGQLRRTAASVGTLGRLEEVIIRAQNLTFIVSVLSEQHFLAVALRPEGNQGKGRFLVRLAGSELQALL